MDNNDELNSSEDEQSDADYCPLADSNRSAHLSEEDESGNESAASGDDDDATIGKRKKSRQKANAVRPRKRKAAAADMTDSDDAKPPANDDDVSAGAQPTDNIDAEQREKARADALWADFLNDPPSRPPTAGVETTTSKTTSRTPIATVQPPPVKKQIVTETVEYAGEKIEITKEVDVPAKVAVTRAIPTSSSSASTATTVPNKTPGPPRRGPTGGGGGGLSAILSQMNKTKKIGTLEKSKLDWNSFKRTEGIDEQLQTHNRGKDGYLDRQDFLQRTDVRQFEREKDLRQTARRSNTNR